MFNTKKELEKVKNFLLSYFDTYLTKRDFKNTIDFIDNKFAGFGSGKDEVGKTREETISLFKRDIEQCPSPIDYYIVDLYIEKINRGLFLSHVILEIHPHIEEIKIKIDLRISFLITKKLGKLKIRHFHVSIPYKEQKEEESFPIETVKKQKEILEEMLKEKTQELEETIKKLKEIDKIKNTIFAVVTHDIRTPFSTAISFLDLIEKEVQAQTPEFYAFWQPIKAGFQNVISLVENLILWAREQIEEQKNMEPVVIEEIIEEVTKLYHRNIEEKEIKIILKLENSKINANKNLLRMIFRNLIYNSIKYSHKGGCIKIKDKKIGNTYSFIVEDNGLGINENKIKKILELTKNKTTLGTANETGTGMGLFLINQILSKQNGKIKVKSLENKWTRVIVMLQEM